jgi:RNA polymerase sigma factor (sigma-70 family)
MERARDGDIGAYEELVRRYQQVAVRVASVIAGASEAQDAVQDAFLKAYAALSRFRPGAPFRPWILRIVANEARNRGRSARRREDLALRLAGDRPSGDAAPSPEAVVLERRMNERLLGAVWRLPERDRIVIAYRYFVDLPEAELAEILGVRPGTVKSRLSRALARLRQQLPPEEGGALDG